MKRVQMFIVSVLLAACVFYPAVIQSQTGGTDGQSDNRAGWYCPYCGDYMGPGYGRGPGMMGPGYGGGYGMGPGMMGPGYGYGPQYRQPSKPLDEKDAKAEVEDYIKGSRNPNLKMGSVKDKGSTFEVEILTKDNSLVDRILVDKNTGWMKSEY
jgi:hypothetical protein